VWLNLADTLWVSWEDVMASKTMMLAGGALALVLGACSKKEEAPAAAPAAETAAPATPGVAVGEPNPATPGVAQTLNTGAPVDGDATVTPPATVRVGANFEAGWTGPGNTGDYIDLVPRGNTETSGEINYAWARESVPLAKLRAPTTPGDYDVRYIVQLDGVRKIKATAPVTVSAVAATLTAPAKAEGGEPFTVTWTGPNATGDYIDIVPAAHTETSGEITYVWTRDGSPANLTAPGKAGAYQVRYLLEGPGGRKVLASSSLAVSAAAATLKAPDTAAKGSKIKVEWTGPKRKGDYVDLVKKGHKDTSGELSYFYTDRSSTSELTAPAAAGDYEIRYLLEAPGGRQMLATRPTTVR
jgi:Ca-activated chloride channel homolog